MENNGSMARCFNDSILVTMTPAMPTLKKSGVLFAAHEYPHDPRAESYGLEAATALGVPPEQVFKTLIVKLDTRELVVAVVIELRPADLIRLCNAAMAPIAK